MGDLVELASAHRLRARRRQAIAAQAAMHPALRWSVPGDGRAHRRLGRTGATTACGKPGPLLLALSGTPLCRRCYPDPR